MELFVLLLIELFSLGCAFTVVTHEVPLRYVSKGIFPKRGVVSMEGAAGGTKGVDADISGSLPPWLPSFSTAATGGLLFGSDIGSSSSVVRILGSGTTELGAMDPLQLGQVASVSLLGAIGASGVLIGVGDKKVGRKTELIAASLFYLVGTLLQGNPKP